MEKNNILLIIAMIAVLVSLANLGISYNKVDKITGHVDEEAPYATLESNGTAALNGTWSYGPLDGLVLLNLGNVNLSITLQSVDNDFLDQSQLGGEYKWKVSDDNNEDGSCAVYNESITEDAWFDVTSTSQIGVCNDFLYVNNTDEMRIDVYIEVSEGLTPGTYSETIIARGTAI